MIGGRIQCCVKHARPELSKLRNTVMRQTWGSPGIAKAETDDPQQATFYQEYKWLLDVASLFEPAMRRAFLEALKHTRTDIDEEALRDAITRGDVNAALRALDVDGIADDMVGLGQPIEDNIIRVGRLTPEKTPLTAGMRMRFDLSNPKTAKFIADYKFNLIKDISDKTRDGIRKVIEDAFAWGGHPTEQARKIRDMIGLTDTQAAAVDNYRSLLEDGDRQALTRQLRDRRHDRTLNRTLGANAERELSPEEIDTQVGRYASRMLDMRADTIARTETMRASNAASNLAWAQAADEGLIDAITIRRFWLVTEDDRLCEFCEAVPDDNPDGVGLDEPFDTAFGPVMYGPLHPKCRCITFLAPGRAPSNNPPDDQESG